MSKYPITVEQWDMVTEKTQYKNFWIAQQRCLRWLKGNKSDPMSFIDQIQIIDFCQYLSQKTEILFRTPISSEWEYACRAGMRTPYHFGDTITTSLANFNNDRKTPVGSFPPNRFGLYDLHGNVHEWCGARPYRRMGILPDIDDSETNLINLDYEAHSLVEIEKFFHDIRRQLASNYVRVKGGGYSSPKKECLASVSFERSNSYKKDLGFRLICS